MGGTSYSIALTVTIAILIILICLYIYYRIRACHETRFGKWQSQRLRHLLNMGNVDLFTYDTKTNRYRFLRNDGKPAIDYSAAETALNLPQEQYDILSNAINLIIKKKKQTIKTSFIIKGDTTELSDSGKKDVVLSVQHWDNGMPAKIVGTAIDVSENFLKQRQSREHVMRYDSIFHTMTLDVVAFDANGMVTDMNDRAQKLFNTTIEKARKDKLSYSQAIDPKDLENLGDEAFHATLLLDPLTKQRAQRPIKVSEAFCYELKLQPVFGSDHQLLGYYGSGLNVNERAQAYREIQKSSQQVEQATKLIASYIKDIDYVMTSGGALMISYSPTSHTFTIFKGTNQILKELTQSQYISMLEPESRASAVTMFTEMDNLEDKTVTCTIQTEKQKDVHPTYYHLELIPRHDKENRVKDYLGISFDISEMESTRHLLEKETAHAHQVESQKNTFLHDMSFEIRTPLNAVVGFAELLKQSCTKDDENVFISQIKDNSSFLLHLINGILFISRLDAHMVEIEKKPTDIVASFANFCQSGWEEYRQKEVDCEVEIPYDELVVEIDEINVGHIIRQLTANAAQNTSRGAITAICKYENEALVITVTDTGRGMSESILAHAFDRFTTDDNQGVGLGLPICQELASQMGGTIHISSHLRHGTTVTVNLPCKANSIIRKEDKPC